MSSDLRIDTPSDPSAVGRTNPNNFFAESFVTFVGVLIMGNSLFAIQKLHTMVNAYATSVAVAGARTVFVKKKSGMVRMSVRNDWRKSTRE